MDIGVCAEREDGQGLMAGISEYISTLRRIGESLIFNIIITLEQIKQ